MSETITIKPIDTEKIREEETAVNILVETVKNLSIKTHEESTLMAGRLQVIKVKEKELTSMRKSITVHIDATKKAVMDLFRPPITALQNAEKTIKVAMITFSDEQEKKQREIQAKLRREADEKARKERERLETRAKKAEETGKAEKAEALREQVEEVVAEEAVVVAAPEKPKGISFQYKYTAEVVNIKELPREYMIANQQALDKFAGAMKGAIPIPGVKFHKEKVMSSRA